MRSGLIQMQQAIRGEVVLTSELQQAMADIFDARVPRSWLFTPGGDEFSWLITGLGGWFASLLDRDAQLRTWLTSGRPTTFWMTGFANAQGFLTAMRQEVTRLHRAQQWALDDVEYFCEVTEHDRPDGVKGAPKEGVYVHGLFVDGARWDKGAGSLAESEPKKMFASLPVLYVTTMTKALLREKMASVGPVYDAPAYRYPARNDRYKIFSINLPTKGASAEHWTLRGVAVLALVST